LLENLARQNKKIIERRKINMGFFTRKSKVDKALELFNSLSDEELEEFLNKADLDGDGDVDEEDTGKKDTEEQIEEAEENAEEKGEEPNKAEIDESVAMQEKDEGDTDSQDAKDRVDEAEGEEEHLEKEDETEDYEEVIQALEKRIETLEERLEKVLDSIDDKSFGNHKAEATEGEEQEKESPIMRNYMRKQTYR
jgi:superfamily I DNA/RNA helicase